MIYLRLLLLFQNIFQQRSISNFLLHAISTPAAEFNFRNSFSFSTKHHVESKQCWSCVSESRQLCGIWILTKKWRDDVTWPCRMFEQVTCRVWWRWSLKISTKCLNSLQIMIRCLGNFNFTIWHANLSSCLQLYNFQPQRVQLQS